MDCWEPVTLRPLEDMRNSFDINGFEGRYFTFILVIHWTAVWSEIVYRVYIGADVATLSI